MTQFRYMYICVSGTLTNPAQTQSDYMWAAFIRLALISMSHSQTVTLEYEYKIR